MEEFIIISESAYANVVKENNRMYLIKRDTTNKIDRKNSETDKRYLKVQYREYEGKIIEASRGLLGEGLMVPTINVTAKNVDLVNEVIKYESFLGWIDSEGNGMGSSVRASDNVYYAKVLKLRTSIEGVMLLSSNYSQSVVVEYEIESNMAYGIREEYYHNYLVWPEVISSEIINGIRKDKYKFFIQGLVYRAGTIEELVVPFVVYDSEGMTAIMDIEIKIDIIHESVGSGGD